MRRPALNVTSRPWFTLTLLLFFGLTSAALGDAGSDSKTVGNVVVYLGVLPAQMTRSHPAEHPESSMHGGRPTGSGEYHVVIALFDAKSGARISNAVINARVSEPGLVPEVKKLEPMAIAGTETYGNYFRMFGNGPFRISLAMRVPGEASEFKVEFEHRHQ